MPISMPVNVGFTEANFYLETNTQSFTSPVTKTTQVLELDGARWRATYSLPKMRREQAAQWIAFFLKCAGRANKFLAYDADWKTNLGPGTGTPLVKGAGQTGGTLEIDGCTPSVTGWLRASDYVTVNGQLVRLTQNADTDGSGNATLFFEPPLIESPADNLPITTTGTQYCEMILVDDSQGQWPTDKNGIYQEKTFSGYEPLV